MGRAAGRTHRHTRSVCGPLPGQKIELGRCSGREGQSRPRRALRQQDRRSTHHRRNQRRELFWPHPAQPPRRPGDSGCSGSRAEARPRHEPLTRGPTPVVGRRLCRLGMKIWLRAAAKAGISSPLIVRSRVRVPPMQSSLCRRSSVGRAHLKPSRWALGPEPCTSGPAAKRGVTSGETRFDSDHPDHPFGVRPHSPGSLARSPPTQPTHQSIDPSIHYGT